MSFVEEPRVNFQVLNNLRDKNFKHELRTAPYFAKKNELADFFSILLSHFQKRIHTRTGNAILLSICKSLYRDEAVQVFAKERMIELLPYAQKEFRTQLLDLLYILVSKVPDIFNDRIAVQIAPLAKYEPRKVLTLIAIFAQSFETVHEPFPMVDILFRWTDYFKGMECADDYISLLCWLMANKPAFRKDRNEHCWTYVCDMLSTKNIAILNNCYYAICFMAEIDKKVVDNCGYPTTALSRDIRRKPVQLAALSLLVRCPPKSDTRKMEDILQSLIVAAADNEKAALILMQLLTDEVNAHLLLHDPQWMCRGLPGAVDTMRIFCILLLHNDIKPKVMEIPETIDLLFGLLSSNSVGMTGAISTIIRKLPLTPEFVKNLSKRGFLASYFHSILENEDFDVLMSGLRLLDSIARVCYVTEMSEMVETVARLIKNDNPLSNAAASVAVDLCRHKKCAVLFKEQELPEFFQKPSDDPKMRKYGSKFLQEYEKHNQE